MLAIFSPPYKEIQSRVFDTIKSITPYFSFSIFFFQFSLVGCATNYSGNQANLPDIILSSLFSFNQQPIHYCPRQIFKTYLKILITFFLPATLLSPYFKHSSPLTCIVLLQQSGS